MNKIELVIENERKHILKIEGLFEQAFVPDAASLPGDRFGGREPGSVSEEAAYFNLADFIGRHEVEVSNWGQFFPYSDESKMRQRYAKSNQMLRELLDS